MAGEYNLDLDKRFVDNGDGTVTDLETKLMWKQTDSYQDTSKWVNWFRALEYVKKLNLENFGGHNDWRIPDLEEAEGLYDEDHAIRDTDRMDIFISATFSPGGGFTTWTSNELPHATAAIYYYRYGHANSNHKEDITKDSVRAVRDIEKSDKETGAIKKYPGFSESPLPR
ncbi:MAG: DUF1566 domain-containing protein [Nitrospinaceae bacterium]|nr:DUF1566 domain-containing protein [Nitrospina sp.]MBT5868069.1 DUF1566 domain-containing protein [Nitrospinaceae bacterium]MBT6345111.1 DUF1566 domain-containing protein [Nitrospina sp.]